MRQSKLSDVAKLAKVSLSAAGKVLNGGSDGIRVGAETRKRIVEAAAQLGYQRNVAASVLRGGDSKLLGVIADTYAHYRTAAVFQAVERAAEARGMRLMTCSAHDNVRNLVESYHDFRRHFSARVLMLAHDYPGAEPEVTAAFRGESGVVFLDPPCFDGAQWVEMRNFTALKCLVRRRLEAGRRRFGILHGSLRYGYNRRLVEDFDAALRAAGLDPSGHWHGEITRELPVSETCRRVAAQFELPGAPQVLFADKTEHAVALQGRLQACGWRIPEDLEIVSGDHDPLHSLVFPEIPTLDPGYDAIAAAMLDALLAPGDALVNQIVEAGFDA